MYTSLELVRTKQQNSFCDYLWCCGSPERVQRDARRVKISQHRLWMTDRS